MCYKPHFFVLLLISFLFSCNGNEQQASSVNPINWENHYITKSVPKAFIKGQSYLSTYSQIYGQHAERIYDLTATISLRNTNTNDSVIIEQANYYNTKGELVQKYFTKPVLIMPLETVEIIIDEVDVKGGTGAKFLFDWRAAPKANEPIFEAVMISTSGQLGLSFVTNGYRVK